MRVALIRSGVVVAIVAGVRPDPAGGWVVDGGTSDGAAWTPPTEYGPVAVVDAGPAELGWSYSAGAWTPPGLTLDAALAAVSAISDERLAAGGVHRGVRFRLEVADRVDWLGLLVLADALPLPVRVVGVDGALTLATVAEVQAAARELAGARLAVQRRSAEARELLAVAGDDQERAAIVRDYASGAQ